jgi:hypothetical protein
MLDASEYAASMFDADTLFLYFFLGNMIPEF